MSKEIVTIIIPVYNAQSYLSETLESIISQTYKNLDIIVIDDGSSDGSAVICDEYSKKDKRIRVLHTENKGLASARNLGLSTAKGSFVLFVDSDDWIEPNTIELLYTMACQQEAIIVSGRKSKEYVGKTIHSYDKKERTLLFRGEDILVYFSKEKILGDMAWNKLYQISCFKKYRFPDGRNYEDVFTTWKIVKHVADNDGIVVVLPNELFHHRMRKSSISHTKSLCNIVDCWDAYRSKYEELPDFQKWLLPDCIMAIVRMWLNYMGLTKDDKEKATDVIREMKSFSKAHCHEVMTGNYPYSIKISCLLSQNNSFLIMWLCHFGNILRMKIKNYGRKLYD